MVFLHGVDVLSCCRGGPDIVCVRAGDNIGKHASLSCIHNVQSLCLGDNFVGVVGSSLVTFDLGADLRCNSHGSLAVVGWLGPGNSLVVGLGGRALRILCV